jgi:SNF2 family DNA or RNA helicase
MKLAALIQPNSREQIDSLYQAFERLDKCEQSILMVLSVIFKPIGISKLTEVIAILIEQDVLPNAKKDYVLSIEQRESLTTSGLLKPSRDGLQVHPLLANRIMLQMNNLPAEHGLITPGHARKESQGKSNQTLLAILLAAEEVVPVINSYSWQKKDVDNHRLVRDFYYLHQPERMEEALAFNKNPQLIDHAQNRGLVELLFLPFTLDSFLALPKSIQYQAFASLFRVFEREGESVDYALSLLEQVCMTHPEPSDALYNVDCHHLLAQQYLYQLRLDDFYRIQSAQDKSCYGLQLLGAACFLSGDNKLAIAYFEQALVAKNKFSRRKKQYLHEVLGYFYKLALIVQANQSDAAYYTTALQQAEFEQNDRALKSDFATLAHCLVKPILSLSSGSQYTSHIQYNSVSEKVDYLCHQLDYFTYLLAQVWCNNKQDAGLVKQAHKHKVAFEQLSYPLFASWCEQLTLALSPAATKLEELEADAPQQRFPGLIELANLIKTKSQWDVALDKLIALNPSNSESPSISPSKAIKPIRLIWELHDGLTCTLQGREQKLSKAGWSKGRVVSLKRLKTEVDLLDYLSDSDKRICRHIRAHQGWGYYAKTEYTLEGLTALNAAVGIDNLYIAGDLERPIDLVKREPELIVSEQGEQLVLSIADLPDDLLADYQEQSSNARKQSAYSLKYVNGSEYQLTFFSPEHMKVAEIIGEGGLLIPISAKQKALDGISAIAPFLNIQSDIAELDTGLETRECDPNLMVNIEPTKTGLAFTCVVMPFGERGPAFKPGLGNASLSTDINGKRIATQRDLVREQNLLDELDKACPAFLQMSDNSLLLDDLQNALAALEELEDAIKQARFNLVLRWPKGRKISLTKKLESQHLQLSLGKKSEWFDITGDLHVNDEEVIELRRLLELVKTSNGRFIELGSEQILALSDELRHKLDLINQVTDEGSFHPLASLQIEEATSGMRMKTLHAWDDQTKRMHQANDITPVIPSTFQALLRDYQVAGFDWGMRLAHWGAGACLADDMGLGKTLQALAILLARAKQGPSLVIAPTSVCFNWQQESLKFSPTLNIKLFADATNTIEREVLLNELKPFDCVIISYGLLQRESELLKQVHWHSIVADEAQALKNPLAKRTKAAYALKGDFKMITTGTPIENDLTELWSLFRFINPGLLGNVKRFSQRFSIPIENAREDKLAARKASQALKALIQPFILRRMKNQVLTELPSRTEINIPVEMSTKEYAFYEALRLNAIDNISQNGQQANPGEQRIKMLAELVKLRQACCHPKLVMSESEIPSAKLAALDVLLDELKLNNHKALIFSQFVGHLQLIKKHIEAKGFVYQYLDGSTPQKDRQNRVNAFQAGEGDIFLISLKAGGSGLNLTAADYVIHMDPWWNPAVEDQASDRAHRMGQLRPVTIYRLITQNTIEERIVALHQHKRDLADKLLSGNEAVTKLSVEDMMNLLKETF